MVEDQQASIRADWSMARKAQVLKFHKHILLGQWVENNLSIF